MDTEDYFLESYRQEISFNNFQQTSYEQKFCLELIVLFHC